MNKSGGGAVKSGLCDLPISKLASPYIVDGILTIAVDSRAILKGFWGCLCHS